MSYIQSDVRRPGSENCKPENIVVEKVYDRLNVNLFFDKILSCCSSDINLVDLQCNQKKEVSSKENKSHTLCMCDLFSFEETSFFCLHVM